MAPRPTHYQKRSMGEKAKIIALAEVGGAEAAAREAGLNESTIRYWMDDPKFADIRGRAREPLIPEYQVALRAALAAIVRKLSDPDVPMRELADAFDRIGNRLALDSGQATARTEHRDLTDGDDAPALQAAADAYLASLGIGSPRVGRPLGAGASPDGYAALPALPVPGVDPAGRLT
jgi:hypothetical protein